MIRFALVLSIATIAAPPAHALEVGATVQFKGPVAGCTFYGDARELLRLRTLGNYRGAQFYVDSLAIDREMAIVRAVRPNPPPLYVDGKIRYCLDLGPLSWSKEPKEYLVVRKSPAETLKRAVPLEPGHTESDPFPMAWFCLVDTGLHYDISPHEPNRPEPDPKTYCIWAFLSDTQPAKQSGLPAAGEE
jgi:hypothetical protein